MFFFFFNQHSKYLGYSTASSCYDLHFESLLRFKIYLRSDYYASNTKSRCCVIYHFSLTQSLDFPKALFISVGLRRKEQIRSCLLFKALRKRTVCSFQSFPEMNCKNDRICIFWFIILYLGFFLTAHN